MKKQTVDSIAKQNLVDEIMTDSTIIPLGTIVYTQSDLQRIKNELKQEREQSDKLWLLFAKGLGLIVIGYMCYHFIRFLIEK